MVLFLGACGEDGDQKQIDKAEITLALGQFRHEIVEGRNRYYHNRQFSSENLIGAQITKGRICVEKGQTCVEALVEYRIDAQLGFQQSGAYFATPLSEDEVTLEYWLVDDNGHEFQIKRELIVRDSRAFILEE